MTATTFATDPIIDLAAYRGQVQSSFTFQVYDFPTSVVIGTVQPIKGTVPVLTHDTTRNIVRQISNLYFTKADTLLLNPIRHRIKIQMNYPGRTPYDLGTYMFIDQAKMQYTSGTESTATMVDEMLIVDQQIEQSYSPGVFTPDGVPVTLRQVDAAIGDVLTGVPVTYDVAPTPYNTIGSWAAGAMRGQVLGDLAVEGDYFNPWFNNAGRMKFIRSFDAAAVMPDFDYDLNHPVDRGSIVLLDDLIAAPNRFIVISNGNASAAMSVPIVGTYDVPQSAPHSIANRGFVVPSIEQRQVDTAVQANAIAALLGQQQTVVERVEFSTPPDPRHDGYNTFTLNGAQWLEIGWDLPLIPGGAMRHVGRKVYNS